MKPTVKKGVTIASIAIVLLFGIFFYVKFYYVFGEGVKAGELNYFVKKGYIFKTYEGKLIQAGYRSQGTGAIQSYEFQFSVANQEVADSLMRCSGKQIEVHYKEYLGKLPWRGYSEFIVDEIVSAK